MHALGQARRGPQPRPPTSAERIALGFGIDEPAEDPDNGRGEVTAALYKATDRIGDGGPLHET